MSDRGRRPRTATPPGPVDRSRRRALARLGAIAYVAPTLTTLLIGGPARADHSSGSGHDCDQTPRNPGCAGSFGASVETPLPARLASRRSRPRRPGTTART